MKRNNLLFLTRSIAQKLMGGPVDITQMKELASAQLAAFSRHPMILDQGNALLAGAEMPALGRRSIVVFGQGNEEYFFQTPTFYAMGVKIALTGFYASLATMCHAPQKPADKDKDKGKGKGDQPAPPTKPDAPIKPPEADGVLPGASAYGVTSAITYALAKENIAAIVDMRTVPLRKIFKRALAEIDSKTEAGNRLAPIKAQIESLLKHVDKTEQIYRTVLNSRDVLPCAYSTVGLIFGPAMMPDLCAQVLDNQLMEILYPMFTFADCIGQELDDDFADERLIVQFFCESLARELLSKMEALEKAGKKIPQLPFTKGDFWMAHVVREGLSTLPANGPIGANAVQVDRTIVPALMNVLAALGHEWEHDVYGRIPDFAKEMGEVLRKGLQKAYDDKKLVLSQEEIVLGANSKKPLTMKTIDLLIALFTQGPGEEPYNEFNADANGLMMLQGVGGWISMGTYFKALVDFILNRDVFDPRNPIPNNTAYRVAESKPGEEQAQVQLEFEPHLPMYIRLLIDSFILDSIGMADDGKFCRGILAQLNGQDAPLQVSFNGGRGIGRVSTLDVENAGKLVADMLLNSPLPCLGGAAMRDIMSWTLEDQKTVTGLVAQVAAYPVPGSVPTPLDPAIKPRHLAAACPLALRQLVDSGLNPHLALKQVEKAGRAFMLQMIVEFNNASSTDKPKQ
jgi:hypothetical protein